MKLQLTIEQEYQVLNYAVRKAMPYGKKEDLMEGEKIDNPLYKTNKHKNTFCICLDLPKEHWVYMDAHRGHSGRWYDFIMKKHKLKSYKEALQWANEKLDLGIDLSDKKKEIKKEPETSIVQRWDIEYDKNNNFSYRTHTEEDLKYWNQFGITEEILTKFFDVTIPGIGILTLIILLIIIGFIGQTFIARPLKLVVRKIIENVPFLNFIYTALNDLFSAFIGKEKKFTKPVLVKIDIHSNLERIGFVTEENLNFLDDLDKVAVYFPFSYAFTGELLIVSKENIKSINHNSGDVMKFIVSAGLTGAGKTEK
ncbi:MAG: hypothetical protein COC22_01310 [Flavobacteriaceae bacterium]|nr:MAG: hypothetical protein COC22_01310 [Flavobacteriaceae bacterium]